MNGEPTENHLALGGKGALRYELVAHGKMAHSAYPELGESAIEKLLDVLQDVRKMPLPVDEVLGPSTLNIGTIHGGRAPNVIPDEARAEIFFRTVGDSASTRKALEDTVAEAEVDLNYVLEIRRSPAESRRRSSHHRRRVRNGHSGLRRPVGRAVAARAGHHSRGAYARRARAQETVN